MTSRLNPYLQFKGQARDAMAFYHGVFGGELTSNSYAEFGMADDPANASLTMHSQLLAPNGFCLMASDTPPGMTTADGSNIAVSLSGTDDGELRTYWNKLSEGATITVPLEKAPWGDSFGQLTDRFGIAWMINIGGTPQ